MKVALVACAALCAAIMARADVPGARTEEPASPGAVSPRQIGAYQLGIEMGCKDAGKRHGDPEETVAGFCSCVISTLKSTVPDADWQTMYYLSVTGDSAGEERLLGRYLGNLRSCRKGTR